jgi:hypothetical protein
MSGNAAAFGFSWSIDLPTGDAEYAHLLKIHVVWTRSGVKRTLETHYAASFGSTPKTGSTGGPIGEQDGSSHDDTIEFYCENDDGAITASPLSKSVTVRAAAVTSCSGAEAGTPEADPLTRLVYTFVDGVPVLNGGQVPQNVTEWLSKDSGANWTWIGWSVMTSVGQSFRLRAPKPGASATWKVAFATGAIGGDPAKLIAAAALPAAAVVSSGFPVGGLAAPGGGVVTSISAGTITGKLDLTTGWQWAELDGVNWTDPADVNSWLVKFYVRETDSGGTPAGDANGAWREWFEREVRGGARTTIGDDPLQITYRAASDTHHYLEIQCVAVNRLSTNPGDWAGSNTASSVAQGSVIRLNFGVLPAGQIPGDRFNKTTLGPGLMIDPATLKLSVANNLDGNMLLNPEFIYGLDGWTPQGAMALVSDAGAFSPPSYARITGDYAGSMQVVRAKPGERYALKCQMKTDAGSANFYGYIYYAYFDAVSALISSGYNTGIPAPFTAWTASSPLLTPAAPAGTAYLLVMYGWIASISGASSGSLYIDNCECKKQISTGPGMEPDGLGGVQWKPGNGLNVDGSGNAVVKVGTGISFAAGNLIVDQAALAIGSFSGNLDVSRVANIGTLAIGSFSGNLDVSRVANIGTLAIGSFSGNLDISRVANVGTINIGSFTGTLVIGQIGDNLITSAKISDLSIAKITGWDGASVTIGDNGLTIVGTHYTVRISDGGISEAIRATGPISATTKFSVIISGSTKAGLTQVIDVALYPSGGGRQTFTGGILTGYAVIA